jgi:transcriptional regulator with GAF, ATPase, and Fis domain
MERLADTLERVAATDMTILLEGETGTGKEVLANHIHAWSKRASGPLVKVHCAALPEGLLQSELFGHEMGAFTGAVDRRIGRFEQASGGTIFLDEIGEVSLDVQVKLLRVLQEREIDRVGGIEPIPVDVRVIAATNRDVRRMVADGRFREDLFYRLQGMLIHVPPLRERKVEIPGLIEHFRREAVAAGHTAVTGFTTEAVDHLFRAEWPGNIRELRNTVFRAMVMAPGPLVTQADLLGLPPPAPVERAESGVNSVAGAGPDRAGPEAPAGIGLRGSSLLEFVRRNPDASNEECGRALGVSARTALRELSVLIRLGLVVRRGSRRGARYSVSSMRPDDPTGR